MTVKLVRLIVMLFVLAGCVADVTPSPLPEAVIETPVPTDTISPSLRLLLLAPRRLSPRPHQLRSGLRMPTSLQNTRIIGDGIINDFDIFQPMVSDSLSLCSTGLKLFNP